MSWMITVSDAVKLIPKPPAFVDNKKINIDGSFVNSSIKNCLSGTGV